MPKTKLVLETYRTLLQERLAPLQERALRIHGAHLQKEGALSADFEEQAVEMENAEVLERLDASSQAEITQIQAALHRIELGTYGVCAICHKPIPDPRLRAVPTATRCLSCLETK